jgi:hypothetical protein
VPFEPTFKVEVIVHDAAAALFALTNATPTNMIATVITPRRNFDFKLLINFTNCYAIN